ncbi:MAG: crossover junction endodeoxyribonuclease RuvC [Actinomycetota bacterium]|nr:crossover junction endodeoxyribonuclease RuvC [Actinomycetota bacterium]
MFDGVVLGVDPGLALTGLAALRSESGLPQLIWSETVRTPGGLAEPLRLRRVYGAVRDALDRHRAAALAVERVMWGRNVGSALSVARATGVVLLAAADAGVPVEEYAPLEVKMAVTGVGNAGKDQVRRALIGVHRLGEVPVQPDAADAVAVALCHVQQSKMRELMRRSARA